MTQGDLSKVRAAFEHYAARGVFRSYSEVEARGRRAAFRFLWFRDVPFLVFFDPASRVLTFEDVLPDVPVRSPFDRDLRAFVTSRGDRRVPEHRRVDPRRVGVRVVNRGGSVSLRFTLKGTPAEYGVRKAVHLVHEIFMDFLNDGRFVQYLVDHFKLDPELA